MDMIQRSVGVKVRVDAVDIQLPAQSIPCIPDGLIWMIGKEGVLVLDGDVDECRVRLLNTRDGAKRYSKDCESRQAHHNSTLCASHAAEANEY